MRGRQAADQTLPIDGGPPPATGSVAEPSAERADAARNRRRVLDAAARLVAERGEAGLVMDDVASAAGVGVGTVYRRFGDRAGLAYALLDERERDFQVAFLSGLPPLGPGAPEGERIRAFLHAYVDVLEARADLIRIAERAGQDARDRNGAYRTHRAHIAALIRRGWPEADADYLAEAILAPLRSDLYLAQRRERGMTVERIKAGLDQLLHCLDSAPRR